MRIHESAIVDPSAELGEGVIIHPFTVIESGVKIGDGCEIGPHAVIRTGTRMGKGNRVTVGAVLGDHPQDAKFHGEESYLELGDDNEIREYCTIHRASGEGASTVIGNRNMLMAYCHVGHNCHIGNNVSMANSAQLAGHTHVDDFAVLGGLCGTHQFVRVGKMVMAGAYSAIRIDAPPFMMVEGNPARPVQLNKVGLQRRGVSDASIAALRHAFRLLYRSDLNVGDALQQLRAEGGLLPEVQHLVEFLEAIPQGHRGRADN